MNIIEIFNRVFRRQNYHYSQMAFLNRHNKYWKSNSIFVDNIYNKIGTDMGLMMFKHVRITRNPNDIDGFEWYENSDLAQVLSVSPNPIDTPMVFWSSVIRKMLREGIAVVVPRFNSSGILQEIHLADGIVNWEGRTVTIKIDIYQTELDIDNVWIFENPKQNLTAQLDQITSLIDDSLKTLSERLEMSGKLRGFLKIPTKAEDAELRKRAEKRIQNILDVAGNNGEIGFLQQGEEFQELNNTYGMASKEELEFLKLQLYQAFGINEALFTCNYTEEQYRAYYSGVLKVYQRVISEEINRKFFTKTARTQGHKLMCYFDFTDIVSIKDITEMAFKNKYSGILNANEIREMYFGLPAYPGGDLYESNKNAVPVGIVDDNTTSEIQLQGGEF